MNKKGRHVGYITKKWSESFLSSRNGKNPRQDCKEIEN